MTALLRYAMAAIGPVAAAAAQFLLSLLLLNVLDARLFGIFSFWLVASQLLTSVWSALFCAPLLVLLTRDPPEEGQVTAILGTSMAMALAAALVFAGMAFAFTLGADVALVSGVAVALAQLRWLGRAHAYAIGRPRRAMASDLSYASIVAAGAVALRLLGLPSLLLAFLMLAVASIVGMIPIGRTFAVRQLRACTPAAIAGYRPIWREYSGWSLVGVVSTEATMNSHAYLVTLLAGPLAFAPIAATSLLIRPITVATNALGDFERARMARDIGRGDVGAAAHSMTLYRAALLLAWAGTAVAAAGLLALAPHLIFPPRYTLPVLAIGAGSWIALALVRVIRAPDSSLLQAAGAFRPLAWASVYSALLSVAAVVVTILLTDPLWTIASMLGGEVVFAYWVWRTAARWLAEAAGGTPRMATPRTATELTP